MNKLTLTHFLSAVIITATSAQTFAHGDEDHHGHTEQTAFGQPGKATDVARTIDVTMGDNMRFTPDHLAIRQGETVRVHLTNTGHSAHEFVLGTADEIAEHAELMKKFPMMEHKDPNMARAEAGQQAEIIWQFNKAGNFVFACLVPGHSEAGMRGTVTVTINDKATDETISTSTQAPAPAMNMTSDTTAAVNEELSSGEILNVDTAQLKFTIKHGELKNIGMPPMTMIFRLKDPAWATQYKVGDAIHFRVEKVNGALTVTRIELVK